MQENNHSVLFVGLASDPGAGSRHAQPRIRERLPLVPQNRYGRLQSANPDDKRASSTAAGIGAGRTRQRSAREAQDVAPAMSDLLPTVMATWRGRRGASGEADVAATGAAPVRSGGHPARADGRVRLQGVHLRDALPEALLRPVRREPRSRSSRRSWTNGKTRRTPRSWRTTRTSTRDDSFWVPEEARWQYIRDQSRGRRASATSSTRPLEPSSKRTSPSTAWSSTSTSTARWASAPSRTRACSSSSTTSPGTGCATRTSSSPTSSAPPTST